MKIETKYNLKDKVWVISADRAVELDISDIKIYIYGNQIKFKPPLIIIRYEFKGVTITRSESGCYASREEAEEELERRKRDEV